MKRMLMQLSARKKYNYPIYIGSNILLSLKKYLPKGWENKNYVIITDDNVMTYYANILLKNLKKIRPLVISFPAGEKSKNYQTKQLLEEKMFLNRCNRDTIIIALGGGVVGDIAGFVAANYMRGLAYIQIPTSLLAMVDSSVGGKTGINTEYGKNLIGAFWQPKMVIIDLNCLKTLSQTHFINGLIEIIKIFAACDRKSLLYFNKNIQKILNKDSIYLKKIIQRAVQLKMDIVKKDEKENNLRMVLNFGHTIGHAIEKIRHYEILHGFAVGLGMLVESTISKILGYLSEKDYQMIQQILMKLCINGKDLNKFEPNDIVENTKLDKKNKLNQVRYVLLQKMGEVFIAQNEYAQAVSVKIVKKAIRQVSEG